MLYIILISLITLALLTLLVLGLHRYQLSTAQTNADKHNPLPPLDNIKIDRELPDLSLEDDALTSPESVSLSTPAREEQELSEVPRPQPTPEKEQNGDSDSESEPAEQVDTAQGSRSNLDSEEENGQDTEILVPERTDIAIETNTGAGVESSLGGNNHVNQVVEDPASISTSELASTNPPVSADSWQDQIAELKKQGRLDEALRICRKEFPLWSAYQQASLIHRARIKQLSQEELDVLDELAALYRLAAEASFLHDRVKGLPNLSLAQLKLLDLSPVTELEMPYKQIGYTELRLIKKTDIKLLLEKWGKPEAHIRPRELHAEAWKQLCSDTQSTLF